MKKNIIFFASANIASKGVGLIREVAFATFYGVTSVMGALRFSQTMTLVFMNFFTTDTLNAGFLPLFERYKQKSLTLAFCFFWCLLALLLAFSLIIFALLYFAAPWIIAWFAPGFKGIVVQYTLMFMRIFSIGVPFCLLGTLFAYLAMSGGAYFAVSIRPVFESVGLTAGIFLSVWSYYLPYIAWGFVIAHVSFFFMAAAICIQKKLLHSVSLKDLYLHAGTLFKDFWRTVHPLLLLPIFMQGRFVVEKLCASLMAVSVVAAIDYARFIIQTGVNILATPIGLWGLSFFSVIDDKHLSAKLDTIVTILLGITLPITLFLLMNGKLVIQVLYGHGAFDANAVFEANAILTGMSLGFFAQVVSYVLIKVLNAQLKNRHVLMYLIVAILCNILFIILFFRMLGPIAFGIGESLYAGILLLFCIKHFDLARLVKQLFCFLLPSGVLYIITAFYVEHLFEIPYWRVLLSQSVWFLIYWSVIFLIYKKIENKMVKFSKVEQE